MVVIILILGLVIDARTTKLPSFILLLLIRVRSRFIIDAVSAFFVNLFPSLLMQQLIGVLVLFSQVAYLLLELGNAFPGFDNSTRI